MQQLIFEGRQLEDKKLVFDQLKDRRTIYDYGIQKDVTILLVLRLRGGGASDVEAMKISLGLVDIAQAISLWDWDGIMPGPVSVTTLVVNL